MTIRGPCGNITTPGGGLPVSNQTLLILRLFSLLPAIYRRQTKFVSKCTNMQTLNLAHYETFPKGLLPKDIPYTPLHGYPIAMSPAV